MRNITMDDATHTVSNCSNITFMPGLLNRELNKHRMESSTTNTITISNTNETGKTKTCKPNNNIHTVDNQNIDIGNMANQHLLETNSNNKNSDDEDVTLESIQNMKPDPNENGKRKFSKHTKSRNEKYIQLFRDKMARKLHLVVSDFGQTNSTCLTVRRKETIAMIRLKRLMLDLKGSPTANQSQIKSVRKISRRTYQIESLIGLNNNKIQDIAELKEPCTDNRLFYLGPCFRSKINRHNIINGGKKDGPKSGKKGGQCGRNKRNSLYIGKQEGVENKRENTEEGKEAIQNETLEEQNVDSKNKSRQEQNEKKYGCSKNKSKQDSTGDNEEKQTRAGENERKQERDNDNYGNAQNKSKQGSAEDNEAKQERAGELDLDIVNGDIRNLKTSTILENASIIPSLTKSHTVGFRRPSQSVRCSRKYHQRPKNIPIFKERRIRKLIRKELLLTLQASIETSHRSENANSIERSQISSPIRSTAINKVNKTKHHKVEDISPDVDFSRDFRYVNERSPRKEISQKDRGNKANTTETERAARGKQNKRFHSQSAPCIKLGSQCHHKSYEPFKTIRNDLKAQQNEHLQSCDLDCKDCNQSKTPNFKYITGPRNFEIERKAIPQNISKDKGSIISKTTDKPDTEQLLVNLRAHKLRDINQTRDNDIKYDYDLIGRYQHPDRENKGGNHKSHLHFRNKARIPIANTLKDNQKVKKSVIAEYLQRRTTIQTQMGIDGVPLPRVRKSIFVDSQARLPTVHFRKSLRSQSADAKSPIRLISRRPSDDVETSSWFARKASKPKRKTDKAVLQSVEESPPASPGLDTYRRIPPDMSVGDRPISAERRKMASRLTRPFGRHELFKGTVTLDKVLQLGGCCDQTISDCGRVEMLKRNPPKYYGEAKIRQCEQYFQALKKEMTPQSRISLLEYGADLDCPVEEVRPGMKPQAHCNTDDAAWFKFLQKQQSRTPLNMGIDDFIYAKNKDECFPKKRNAKRMSRAKGFKLPTDDKESHLAKILTMASNCHTNGGKCDPWTFTGQSHHRHSLDKASKLTDKCCFKELITQNDKHWADSDIKNTECLSGRPKQAHCAKLLLPSEIEEKKLAFMLRSKIDECFQESHIDPWALTGQTKEQFIINVPTKHQIPKVPLPNPDDNTDTSTYKGSGNKQNSGMSLNRQGNNACVMSYSKRSDRQRNHVPQMPDSKIPPELQQDGQSSTSALITLGDVLPIEDNSGDHKSTPCLVTLNRSSFAIGDSKTTLNNENVSLEDHEHLYSDKIPDVTSLAIRTTGKQNDDFSKIKPNKKISSNPRKRKLQRSSMDIRKRYLTSRSKQLIKLDELDGQAVLKDMCDTDQDPPVAYSNNCPWVVSARCKLEKEGCLNAKMNQERLHLESIRPSTCKASFPFHVPSYTKSNSITPTEPGARDSLPIQAMTTNFNTSCAFKKQRENMPIACKPSSDLKHKLTERWKYATSTNITTSCTPSAVPSLHAQQWSEKQSNHESKLKHNVTGYKQYPQLSCDLVNM